MTSPTTEDDDGIHVSRSQSTNGGEHASESEASSGANWGASRRFASAGLADRHDRREREDQRDRQEGATSPDEPGIHQVPMPYWPRNATTVAQFRLKLIKRFGLASKLHGGGWRRPRSPGRMIMHGEPNHHEVPARRRYPLRPQEI